MQMALSHGVTVSSSAEKSMRWYSTLSYPVFFSLAISRFFAEISAASTVLNFGANMGIHLPIAHPISITDFSGEAISSIAATILPDVSFCNTSKISVS